MASSPLGRIAVELKQVFRKIGYTSSGISGLLGAEFSNAMRSGQPAAVRYRLDQLPESDLTFAIRAFVLRDPIDVAKLSTLCGADVVDTLIDEKLARSVSPLSIQLLIDIRAHKIAEKDQWVFSDADASMTEHIPGSDHVLGVGAASLSLLQATPTTPVKRVLDIGTGSGIQVLGQLGNSEKITATDIHPRALNFAEATLSGFDVELLEGSWFTPVAGREFDRIIANPPFVVGPPEITHIYRDSGIDLDGATKHVVEQACLHLAPGGTAHLLGAWINSADQSWQDRVASWLPDSGYAAWIIQRDAVNPAQYISTWLSDESLDLRSSVAADRTTSWLHHFDQAGVKEIGFGFIAIHRLDIDDAQLKSDILAESMLQHFHDALGPEVEEYFIRIAWLRAQTRESILHSQYLIRPGVAREAISLANTEEGMGFSQETIRLSRTEGPCWSHTIDDHLAAILSGLHPHGLNLIDTLELFAMARGISQSQLHTDAIAAIVDLIRHGLVLPAELISQVDNEAN